jgi:hypothetical protein
VTRYADFDGAEDSGVWQAAYDAGSDQVNHWPAERYLGEGIENAAAHLGTGLAWFGFWLAVGMVALSVAWGS